MTSETLLDKALKAYASSMPSLGTNHERSLRAAIDCVVEECCKSLCSGCEHGEPVEYPTYGTRLWHFVPVSGPETVKYTTPCSAEKLMGLKLKFPKVPK